MNNIYNGTTDQKSSQGGKKPTDNGQWKANRGRFLERKEDIFLEVISLKSKGDYHLVQTSDQDHAKGEAGNYLEPSNSMELYDLVSSQEEFTLLKIIPRNRLQSEDLVLDILKIFVETRKLYELLESKNKMNQRRLFT